MAAAVAPRLSIPQVETRISLEPDSPEAYLRYNFIGRNAI